MKKQFLSWLSLSLLVSTGFAKTHSDLVTSSTGYQQTISIMNVLANTNLPDPGMTPTPLIVKYYNGGTLPCWTAAVNYQDEYIAHAGPGLGCVNKINQISIIPVVVAEKLAVYRGPLNIDIDVSKFSTQIIISEESEPQFDPRSGLVSAPGSMRSQVQS